MFGLGTQELMVILVIVLVLFGGSKLPEIARSLGKSMREFKKGIDEGASEKDDKDDKPKSGA
jgi:sec-independent protein translocase protein TatA